MAMEKKRAREELPSDDSRPWEQWFFAMVNYERVPMSSAEAVQQAELDGLKLLECQKSGTYVHGAGHTPFAYVKKQEKNENITYQSAIWLKSSSKRSCHIANSRTAEEAALHMARFRAYPLGLEAAMARLVAMRTLANEQRSEEIATRRLAEEAVRADKARQRADTKAAKEAEKARQRAEASQRKAQRKSIEEEQKEAKTRAKEEKARAKEAAREAVKAEMEATKAEMEARKTQLAAEQAARLKQAAEDQRRLFREAAERHRQEAACAPEATAAASSVQDGEPPEQQPVEVLVQQALAASGPGGCPYRCLGLLAGAQPEAVRKRYLALALRLHPDRLDHPKAGEAFAAIECANTRLLSRSAA